MLRLLKDLNSGETMKANVFFSACQHDCSDNCSILSNIESGKAVSVQGNPDHTFTRGTLCGKVSNYLDRVYSKDRILHPMARVGQKGSSSFERVTWEEALNLIRDKFTEAIERDGSESILPYSYLGHQGLLNGLHCGDRFFNKIGATIGERTFCNSTASKAFSMVAGPTGGLDPESFKHSRLIIIWGMNLLSTSIHHGRIVLDAVKNGAKLVVIDPITTSIAKKADIHLRPRPGTDVVLALSIANFIIQNNLADGEYLENHTLGFPEFSERASTYDTDTASEITGVLKSEIERVGSLISEEKVVAIRTGVALERNANGGDAIRSIAALPALIGAWRYVGGGIFQHPQGTFPINRRKLARPDFAEAGRRAVNLFDLAEALDPDATKPISCLFVYNSNPVITSANQTKLLANLSKHGLFTVVSEVFYTDTCDFADLILPATSQLEQDDLMYSWGHFNLQLNQKAIEPIGEAVSNTELFRRLSQALDLDDDELYQTDAELLINSMDWGHPNMLGVSLEKLSLSGYARLNVGDPDKRTPHSNGNFHTPSGKFEFLSSSSISGGQMLPAFRQCVIDDTVYDKVDPLPLYAPVKTPPRAFTLLSPKHRNLLNSGYANSKSMQASNSIQRLFINSFDAKNLGIEQGRGLRVFNSVGELSAVAHVTNDIIRGVVAIYHGFWRSHIGGNTVNALVSSSPSRIGKGITVNDTKVWIEPIGSSK